MKRTFDVVEWKQGNLPPEAGEYLVTIDRGYVDILYYTGFEVWRRFSYLTEDFTDDIPADVIAWAELPEAYKEGGESNE